MKKDYIFPVYVLIFLIIFFIGVVLIQRKLYPKEYLAISLPQNYEPTPVAEENKKTITWIVSMYPPKNNAGAEWMAHAMNRFLIEKAGYRVNVIIPSFPKKEFEGVNIIEFQEKEKIARTIRDSAVLLSNFTYYIPTMRIAKRANRPCILVMHSHEQQRILQLGKQLVGTKNLHVVYNSEWMKQVYSSFPYNSTVLYPPVSWKDYRVTVTGNYTTLINLNPNKGGQFLIELAKRMPNQKFLGVKGGYDVQIIDKRISNITYLPNTPRIQEIYAKTKILLVPSKEESWGRVAIEAMASGIPVIAHPTPGLKEACSYAGLFADRENIFTWMNLIHRLNTDEVFYKKQSELAFKRAQELEPTSQLQQFASWIQEIEWKN